MKLAKITPEHVCYHFESYDLKEKFEETIEKELGVKVKVDLQIDEETGGVMTNVICPKSNEKENTKFNEKFNQEICQIQEEFLVTQVLMNNLLEKFCEEYELQIYSMYDNGYSLYNTIEVYAPFKSFIKKFYEEE